MKKKSLIILISVLLIFALILSPLGAYGISLGAMSVYSRMEAEDSYMAQKGVQIQISSGEGWYPFVMTFNADSGFRGFSGGQADRLTIMYNFPEFDLKRGCSRIYDDSSPYYSSFYGAYCVEGDYGFDESGSLNVEEAGKLPEYDYTRLVLQDLGLPAERQLFDWETDEVYEDVKMAGYDGWYAVDAEILASGVLHNKKTFLRNYIQYGSPGYGTEEDFAPVELFGRVYGKYFEELDVSIYFYVISADREVLDDCDENILQKSEIYM